MHILLIEDDEDDVQLLENMLTESNVPFNLQVIGDGADGLAYFKNDNAFPHIIILDFNLPKIHGKEILKEYKMSKYADIPLVVLTTSSAKEDIEFSYKNGATKFLIKPSTRQGLQDVVNTIIEITGDKFSK
jgi:DNA-binding response OmpR family regulator